MWWYYCMGTRKATRFGDLTSMPVRKCSPFLKWAGGKSQLMDAIKRYVPSDFETYYEPFLGGGAVFFALTPEKAVLGDINHELINAFHVVQQHVYELMDALGRHYPHRKDSDYFYTLRKINPDTLGDVDRAARLIFLNKTCYNGLYRVNSKGEFNVPFGRYSNPQLYNKDNLMACSAALKGKLLTSGDYRDILAYARKDDFVYLDPPYHPLSRTANFTSYTKDDFSDKDQCELAEEFAGLDEVGCKVMLSNSSTSLIRDLYRGNIIVSLKATRAISSNPKTRGAVEELLIMNYG